MPRLSNIKAVLFDFGGTLDSDGICWPVRFRRLYKEEGIDPPLEIFEKAFYSSDDALASRHPLAGLDLAETVLLQCLDTAAALGVSPAAAERVAARFTEQSRAAFRKNAPILESLSQGRRLGIVSNFYGNLASILERENISRFFSSVADSAIVGSVKPDAPIFQTACRALKVSPAECLMVGDSVARDMHGGAALGMRLAFMRGERGGEALEGLDALILDSLTDIERHLSAEWITA